MRVRHRVERCETSAARTPYADASTWRMLFAMEVTITYCAR